MRQAIRTAAGISLFTAFLAAIGPSATQAETETPPTRIVSINLCADQLLIALADPEQILSLSTFATDPRLSYFADKATEFRHDAGNAESVVGLQPDIVLAGRFTRLATREMLTRLGYRLVLLDAVRSIDDAIRQIREVSVLVGHPERGEALVADIEAARRDASAAATHAHRVAFYQRRGYVTGGNTFTSELLETVGFNYAGGELAGATGGFVPLERLVADAPDYIVVSSTSGSAEDQGTALLSHPALAALFPPERRIALPDRLTVCAGPATPEALHYLSQAARRLPH
jgi:iron complex transport system substrate-binding protein